MSKSHNKKRNTGIIFEQLVLFVADAVIEKRFSDAKKAVKILHTHFKPESELYREFRLFNALIKTRVNHPGLATRILNEAREATRTISQVKLRAQKSRLIKDINHRLNEHNFYNKRIVEYKNYATIQTLMNDWRRKDCPDLRRITEFEDGVCKWLLQEDSLKSPQPLIEADQHDALTLKLFFEKFNKKYVDILNNDQIEILNAYVFSSNNDHDQLVERLKILQENVLIGLSEYIQSCENDVLLEKREIVTNKILEFNPTNICDQTISRALMLSSLYDEILGDGDEKS